MMIASGLLSSCLADREAQRQGVVDTFGDVRILRFQLPQWDSLTPQQRILAYYLTEAALAGRDIYSDQNYRHNLTVRRILEAVYKGYTGERRGAQWEAFTTFLKLFWYGNGLHHPYAETKLVPDFPPEYLRELLKRTPMVKMPAGLQEVDSLETFLLPILYDPLLDGVRVDRSGSEDVLRRSASNFYHGGVTQAEAEAYYRQMREERHDTLQAFGMNSQLAKGEDGKLYERTWNADGMYGSAIKRIIYWLEKAQTVAENLGQREVIARLIRFYKTGDPGDFDSYSIAWLQETHGRIDFVNGFIEDYDDPLAIKCSWEALVNYRDMESTRRLTALADNAQWFEDNAPIEPRFRKPKVRGIAAKAIHAITLGGACYPNTPIGINLPNASWIREKHGSKSVSITNISEAYQRASEYSGMLEAFAENSTEIRRARRCHGLASQVMTDLHECLGHASGQLLPDVQDASLKEFSSTIEETRADLFALYYIMDPKLVELGILPDAEYGQAEYDAYLRNALITQLVRVPLGENLQEAHMRNRSIIGNWLLSRAAPIGAMRMIEREGRTYLRIENYAQVRVLIAELLGEVQRIRSTGNYLAAQALVEQYGVKVDGRLHAEVVARYKRLSIPSYTGFVNPVIEPVMRDDTIVDARVRYDMGYVDQMLLYSERYSTLPLEN